MKNQWQIWSAAILLLMGLSFTACQKEDTPVEVVPTEASYKLAFDHKVGTADFTPGTTYTINGKALRIDNIFFYISNPIYKDMDDNMQVFPETHLLVDASSDAAYDLGMAPTGHVHELKFMVGVDSAKNAPSNDPTSYPVGHPLGVQDPSMAWSWAAGYIFVRIDAQVDTDGDNVVDSPQVFHLGRQGTQREVELMAHTDVETDSHTFNVTIDWEKFFTNLDPETEGGHTIGEEYSDNIPSMFSM